MPKEMIRVGVLGIARPPATRWAERVLLPLSVGPDLPGVAAGARVAENDGAETWYLGGHGLHLHSGDTGNYRDNLVAARPSVWVALRGANKPESAEVMLVTVDPYEGEALAGDPALTVEAVPMPADINARVADFVARHHVEIPFKKRRRRPVDVEADPRGPRVLPEGEKWGRR
jgi:hypothetical protein